VIDLERPRFARGPRERTFLLEGGVFSAGPGPKAKVRRVGSVGDYAQAVSGIRPGRAQYHPDVLGDAGPLLARVHDLQFCLAELLPYLKSLSGAPPAGAPGTLDELARRARELEAAVDDHLALEPYAEDLAESLGAPCAILARSVIPIERATRKRKSDFHVELNGHTYRYCLDRTESLNEFVRRAGVALRAHMRVAVMSDEGTKTRLKEFSGAVHAILSLYEPEKRGSRSVFHRDDQHQLQYCGGSWLLVRGPLPVRTGQGTVFVALNVRGRTRAERLSLAPSLSRSERGLWGRSGQPVRAGLCMGTLAQYQRLLSKRFSDAEAVVQWLDAGAILATDRPEFHRMWRERTARHEEEVPF